MCTCKSGLLGLPLILHEVLKKSFPFHDCPAPNAFVMGCIGEQKVVEEEELIALNPRQKLTVPLVEKEVLSDNSCRFRFALPTEEHKLGLPVGKVRLATYRCAFANTENDTEKREREKD